MRLALGTNLKFYTSVAKGLKLKVRTFWRLIPSFAEVTEEKLVGADREGFLPAPILNRVKVLKPVLKAVINYVNYSTFFSKISCSLQMI